jgi:branched-chain amino acid transport system ATP-binding protein
MSSSAAILEVNDLNAWYDQSKVLHGLNLHVDRGEIVTLLGRNGAGKTSTLRAIMGLIEHRAGSIRIGGRETIRWTPENIARGGVGYCPEERGIYATLSVEENLLLPEVVGHGAFSVPELYELFPHLSERRRSQGTKLSGGEQQMLAIARILRMGASLLLLDEPTEGLAPIIVHEISKLIGELKRRGLTILLVEQNVKFAASLADRNYIVECGHVIDTITKDAVAANLGAIERYLAV